MFQSGFSRERRAKGSCCVGLLLGPSCASRAVAGEKTPYRIRPFRCGRLSKNRLWPPLEGQFSRIFQKGATRDPKVAQREPKRAKGRPKASQTGPKAAPKRDKRSSMASQRDPKEPPGTQNLIQTKPIYTKTRDQPHQRPLCYFTCLSCHRMQP